MSTEHSLYGSFLHSESSEEEEEGEKGEGTAEVSQIFKLTSIVAAFLCVLLVTRR